MSSDSLLIRHGTLCHEDRLERADILIRNGRITRIGAELHDDADGVIDATGLHILPGCIDIHTHLDDVIGGVPLADGYRSGSEAALLNGVTTLFSFITQGPGESLTDAVERTMRTASGACHCDHHWHLTPLRFDATGWRDIVMLVDRGFRTFKFYTTYREAGLFMDYGRLGDVARRLKGMDAVILVHCEDEAVLASVDASHLEPADASWHALLRPEAAEVAAVRAVLAIAKRHHAVFHIVHVSTADAAALIHDARAGSRVTCETCPQYVHLTDDALAGPGGHRWLCSPPLRTETTRRSLVTAVLNGYVDCLATDHCAFHAADKDAHAGDVRAVPKGLAGLGSLVPMTWALLEEGGPAALTTLVRILAANPARITGIHPRKGVLAAGADADIIVLDLDSTLRAVHSSRSDAYETHPDALTRLSFRHVLLRGREVVRNDTLIDPDHPGGMPLATQ